MKYVATFPRLNPVHSGFDYLPVDEFKYYFREYIFFY